jgi:hypothetical protein
MENERLLRAKEGLEIAKLLVAASKQEALNWEPNGFDEKEYMTILGDSTIKISVNAGNDVNISVYNSAGLFVQGYSEVSLPHDERGPFRDAYLIARRKALRIDEVVSGVLNTLRSRVK